MGEATRQARQDVAAARVRLSAEVDELTLAVRSAVDIPAKVRRNPARAAALGGGAVFLAAGGPKRLAKRIARAVRREKPSPIRSLLPDEIERIVERAGENAADARAALESGFADYLERGRKARRKKDERRTRDETFWHLFDTVSAPIAGRAAKNLAEQLFEPDPDRRRAREGRDDRPPDQPGRPTGSSGTASGGGAGSRGTASGT